MEIQFWAAVVYVALSFVVVAFQVALAAGAPWGQYALGGMFKGRFPPRFRIAALIQAAIILFLAGTVASRARLAFTDWSIGSGWQIWLAVAFSTLALVLNSITPSKKERAIWAPIAFLLFASSVIVATS